MGDVDEQFRAYVRGRRSSLLRTAFLLVGDHDHAEDIVQIALTKTYRHWDRIDHPDAYVRRALVTTATSWWRRRWHGEGSVAAVPDQARTSDETKAVQDHEALWPEVLRLPARQRAVVVLRFYEDLSESDTAAALGCSTGTVKSQTSRALAALRGRPAVTDFRPCSTGPQEAGS